MEHRHSKRVPANVRLRLFKRGEPVAAGRLKDVSKHGLFVAMDSGDVGLNQILEVEFRGPDRPEVAENRMSAVVVHKSGQGMGLELADEDQSRGLPDLYSWLRRRLRNEQASGAGVRSAGEAVKKKRTTAQQETYHGSASA